MTHTTKPALDLDKLEALARATRKDAMSIGMHVEPDTILALIDLARSAQPSENSEYLAMRLGRVAKAAGVTTYAGWSHDQMAEGAVTILGDIARVLEKRSAAGAGSEQPHMVTCPRCKGHWSGCGPDGVENDCALCEEGMVAAPSSSASELDELHIGMSNNDQGVHVNIIQRHADRTSTVIFTAKVPPGDSYSRAKIAARAAHQAATNTPSAPAGFEAALGEWMAARDYWQDDEHERVKQTWAEVLKFTPTPASAQPVAAAPAIEQWRLNGTTAWYDVSAEDKEATLGTHSGYEKRTVYAAPAAPVAQATTALDPNQVQTIADRIRNTSGLPAATTASASAEPQRWEDRIAIHSDRTAAEYVDAAKDAEIAEWRALAQHGASHGEKAAEGAGSRVLMDQWNAGAALLLFQEWKGYPLPELNADGNFDKDWLHREWVAFQAGLKRRAPTPIAGASTKSGDDAEGGAA